MDGLLNIATGQAAKERNHYQSIHPRFQYPRDQREKRNTCLQPTRKRAERTIAAIERHLENHPNDGVSKAHLAKLQARLAGIPVKAAA